MLWIFGIIIVLVAILLIPNALYAFRQFLQNRNLVWFATYLFFLLLLGYLLIHITTRTVSIVQNVKENLAQPDI